MNAETEATSVLAPKPRIQLSYHNWIHLNPGDRVIVKRHGCEPEHGTIDDIAEDASYFWVRIDGQNRILVFHGDGSTIQKVLH